MKPAGWLESVNCAIEGILWAVRSQRHMRYHCLAAIIVLCIAYLLHLSTLEFILLVLAVTLVIFAELMNTAVEVVVDLVSPDYHPLAKRAKDVAAGAVLAASIGAVVLGYLALSPHLFAPVGDRLALLGRPEGELALVAVLITTFVVILLKARSSHGTPLHGGMPSGHAAVSWSIATSVLLSGVGSMIALLAVVLAAMVSHSRLLLKIHSLREVLAGSLLGTVITLLLWAVLK
ncbi:MAG: diacylglycerol kinase [Desulfuromonas sp.]|nr:MAG: diacylglycerol kinase [Desulfuromonas sp.]